MSLDNCNDDNLAEDSNKDSINEMIWITKLILSMNLMK